VEIPKFDADPSPSPNPRPNPNPSPNSNPMPIRFGQMTLRTSELSPMHITRSRCCDLHFVQQNVTDGKLLVECRNDNVWGNG